MIYDHKCHVFVIIVIFVKFLSYLKLMDDSNLHVFFNIELKIQKFPIGFVDNSAFILAFFQIFEFCFLVFFCFIYLCGVIFLDLVIFREISNDALKNLHGFQTP